MTILSHINQLVRTYDSSDFDPNADAADGVTVGMVLLKDMRDALERLGDRVCDLCQGNGFVENPDARWSEVSGAPGYHTGLYETQDPEEIDCPDCLGVGFIRRKPSSPVVMAFTPTPLDEEVPF